MIETNVGNVGQNKTDYPKTKKHQETELQKSMLETIKADIFVFVSR
jgi:hypothetical protein